MKKLEKFNKLVEKLLKQKCSSCHNLDLPPKTFENEVAPPMMAVAFHVYDFMPATNEADKLPKCINFVKDYVINPSAKKSFCDKKSLQSYGVMPSQKGKVTQDELQAIAEYIFSYYTPQNLQKAQADLMRLKSMPKGKRLALQNNCLTCHKIKLDTVGPSFKHIAKKYKNDKTQIINSIKNGSKGKWKKFKAIMPKFKDKLSDKEINEIANWIINN